MDLVAASWPQSGAYCLLTTVDGGRPVVVVRTPEGRWAACNAFLSDLSSTWQDADRRLHKLLKRRRRGYVACVGPRQATPFAGVPSEHQRGTLVEWIAAIPPGEHALSLGWP